MKNSEALILISKKFKRDKCPLGVCHEITKLEDDKRISNNQKYEMKNRIHKLLGDYGWLESWLRDNVADYDPYNKKKMNETRAQWCVWMAQQWDAQGK